MSRRKTEKDKPVGRRRTGAIANMPKVLRDEINRMLEDGVIYPQIVARVAQQGHEINKFHLMTWRQGGYQDWLREQDRLADMRIMREFAQDVVRENQGKDLQEAAIQIAASHIYQVLMEYNPKKLKRHLEAGDSVAYARLVTALAKLSDGGLKYERYRAEVVEKKERMQKLLDQAKGGHGMSDEELAEFERLLNLM